MKKRLFRIFLIILLTTGINGLSFYLGHTYKPDPIKAVTKFQEKKLTFCNLNEEERFYACPVERKTILVGQGVVVVYTCNKQNFGYLSFLNVSPELKTEAIERLFQSGHQLGPHCSNKNEEIIWLKRQQKSEEQQWKTDSLTL